MQLIVSPKEYLALKRLAWDCEYVTFAAEKRMGFSEERWLRGVDEILGRHVEPGQYEIKVDFSRET